MYTISTGSGTGRLTPNARSRYRTDLACHRVALLTPEAVVKAGLTVAAKILDVAARDRH